MMRIASKALPVLLTGVLLALPAGAQDIQDTRSSPAEDVLADGMTRERLVSLYLALVPTAFEPPACVAGQERFDDVPATSPFCPWIEEFARRGISIGCSPTQYCPGSPVNRGQMAVFVVRAMEACPTMDPTEEMVRVGGVCIDRYEASVWDAPIGGNQLVTQAQIRSRCPDDGQNCKGRIFARSVAGVVPAQFITWFQAQQALANSGKRLPTNAEWQMAASGTSDGAPCVVSDDVQSTGANPGCISDWGVNDMVGNVSEWVADWVPASTHCPGWGDVGEFSSDDQMCLSGASIVVQGPGGLFRGGSFASGEEAGPFSINGVARPSDSNYERGFRGAR